MTFKSKIFIYLFLLSFVFSFGQMQKYSYKRELKGVKNSWHKLVLPNDIFEKISPNLSDLRIFGISEKNDTIEAPYLLTLKSEKQIKTNINFKIINASHNEKGYYFTLEVPNQELINQLQLDFKQFNFDWRISLEGSNNQDEWFTIVDDYRILSIKNAETFYEYSKITFPNSQYRYFRILVKSLEKTELKSVKASYTTIEKGAFYDCNIKSLVIEEKKQEKSSEINIELSKRVPVSYLKIGVNAFYDYYRPIMIKYVSDSIKTQNGYVYNYRTLTNGTLNSIENNVFVFENTVVKTLKIIVNNQDNEPLKIKNIDVKGTIYNLDIRFTEPARYFLTYGNSNVYRPKYDIERFVSKTPDTISSLTLGEEQVIYKNPTSNNTPLFQNKIWLWSIVLLLVAILGWFSIKMMKGR